MCTRAECLQILADAKPYILKKYGVKSLCVFGSYARGDYSENSDVDILVDMPPKIFLLCGLKTYLESLLKTSVDLVRRHSNLSSEFLNEIAKDAVTIL